MDSSSRRIVVLASLASPMVLVLFVLLTVFQGRDARTGARRRQRRPPDPPTRSGRASSPDHYCRGRSRDAVNLLGDPSSALNAFARIYETTPRVRRLVGHPDLATVEVQVPGEPTYVDEYTVGSGEVSGPAPLQLLEMEIEDLESELFDLSEVDATVIRGIPSRCWRTARATASSSPR